MVHNKGLNGPFIFATVLKLHQSSCRGLKKNFCNCHSLICDALVATRASGEQIALINPTTFALNNLFPDCTPSGPREDISTTFQPELSSN